MFFYRDDDQVVAAETWVGREIALPSAHGIWVTSEGLELQIRHLFLSCSAVEIICFCQLYPEWLSQPYSVAFASLGARAEYSQLQKLLTWFPNAKTHLLFENNVIGQLTDCKIALWAIKKDAKIYLHNQSAVFLINSRKITLETEAVSLAQFEKVFGKRFRLKTHKPRLGFNSYFQFLQVMAEKRQ